MKIYLASIISAGFLAGFTLVVNAAETSVSTIAGDGEERLLNGFGTDASFYNPSGMAVDNEGVIYVVDRQNHVIRKITPDGNVATLAGSGSPGFADGTGSAAKFKYLRELLWMMQVMFTLQTVQITVSAGLTPMSVVPVPIT
jgi:hypothetical protein